MTSKFTFSYPLISLSHPFQIVTLLQKKAQFMSVVTWLFLEKQKSVSKSSNISMAKENETKPKTISLNKFPQHRALYSVWQTWVQIISYTASRRKITELCNISPCKNEYPRLTPAMQRQPENMRKLCRHEWATVDAIAHRWHCPNGEVTLVQFLILIKLPLEIEIHSLL